MDSWVSAGTEVKSWWLTKKSQTSLPQSWALIDLYVYQRSDGKYFFKSTFIRRWNTDIPSHFTLGFQQYRTICQRLLSMLRVYTHPWPTWTKCGRTILVPRVIFIFSLIGYFTDWRRYNARLRGCKTTLLFFGDIRILVAWSPLLHFFFEKFAFPNFSGKGFFWFAPSSLQ